MGILLILLILFNHRDTILEVILIVLHLILYLKLADWMRNILYRFNAYTFSPVNYVTW